LKQPMMRGNIYIEPKQLKKRSYLLRTNGKKKWVNTMKG